MRTLRPSSTASSPEDQRDALALAVADPLWMLARQWQTGGLVADDGGTPVRVGLAHATTPLLVGGVPLAGSIEPVVEAEPAPAPFGLDTAARARLATELLRRVRDAGIGSAEAAALGAALARAYPLAPAAAGSPQAVFAGRLPDAAGIYAELEPVLAPDGSGGPFPTLPGVDPADAAAALAVETACRGWFAWMYRQVGSTPGVMATGSGAPAAWDAERLEYAFSASTELPAGAVTLTASGYDGTGADWYSFDRSTLPPLGPVTPVTLAPVRPAPVSYAGMPRPRLWEFEDGHVNLDAMAGTEPAHALLALFAHAYANDWFVVPLEVPPGASLIARLEVTDTFGTTTAIAATEVLDGPTAPWRLWDVSTGAAGGEADAAAGLRINLPASPPPLEGPVVEDVLVARDEMANLAWLIELTTRDGDGATVDRYRRWLQLRSADDPAFNPAGRGAAGSYRLGTALPDHWYPLMATDAAEGRHQLRLAEIPPGATEVSDAGVRGRLVPHAPGTILADEEASRTGTRLRRVDRLTRTPAGRVVWRARTKQPGMGEASSGLRFDVLR